MLLNDIIFKLFLRLVLVNKLYNCFVLFCVLEWIIVILYLLFVVIFLIILVKCFKVFFFVCIFL